MRAASLSAGSMRRRVTLERPALAPDGAGGAERAYTAVARLWAALLPVEPRADGGGDGSARALATHRLVLRWRPDIDAASRFRLGTRVFNVNAVADADPLRRRLVCLIEEETP